ncbi:MAG TPA: hypothetical protein VKY31_11080 [Terriglobia bacterium]|nr:hypothetical protein [Terriglobia bacterium]
MFDLKKILVTTALIFGLALAFEVTGTTGPLALVHSAWAAPVAAAGGAAVDEHHHRYYDPDRKDYHEWTEQEEHAYRDYMKDQHRDYKDFAKLHRKQQREYWHWRHEHPDVR